MRNEGNDLALSMTGYGRALSVSNGREISVEIKSVNSRYFEYNSRLPRNMGFVDEPIKKALSSQMARGKADIYLSVRPVENGSAAHVQVNLSMAKGYFLAMQQLAEELDLPLEAPLSRLLQLPDIFVPQNEENTEETLLQDVLSVTQQAIQSHSNMRRMEGKALQEDLEQRLDELEKMLFQLEESNFERTQKYTARLYERLQELLSGQLIEESRLLTEAAIFADRTAVDEETVRLRSHLQQYRSILKNTGSIGRKLDFLTQEIHREINTIGSKCQELEVTRLVVEMKAETEKMREQVQNIE